MWTSNCCNAPPLEFFEMDFDLTFQTEPSGMCGDCKEHCEFINETEGDEE